MTFYPHSTYIISTPPEMESAQIFEKVPNFERDFLYRPPQKRRTPLPTHQNWKIIIVKYY